MGEAIIIIEQDEEIVRVLDHHFSKAGFIIHTTPDAKQALKMVAAVEPAAVITELDLPGFSGLDLCRELRFGIDNWTPLILISEKNEELDAVLGLELGADDYVTKPLRIKELTARVKSTIRRGKKCCQTAQTDDREAVSRIINIGDLKIDPDHFHVFKNGEHVDLTRKEFELLFYLTKNKGKALSRERLLDELSVDDVDLDVRIIDVFVSRLRQKIESNRKNPIYIKTVRNIGYMMNDVKTPVLS
ncbi:DNA-binding response regulator [Alteribacter lacisalsi]|uniref:DNA-binding response regulator n=1 Tax=Alteribacter lacisalsi TaxID=2045244 RepID=A0A2W0H882_9BACI|nr:response regulator transcription factor [Alteribacter lacisalsi]PYZ97367.1 DNA-binding response regulator [Alteribacter lacisalsi]